MDLNTIFKALEIIIYAGQAWIALYGVFCVVLLARMIKQKQFKTPQRAAEFLTEVRSRLQAKRFDEVAQFCDTPPYWSKVVPQLVLIAIANREKEFSKIRRILAEKFERDVLAEIEYRNAWVTTMIKIAPMLGLLGTVQGMIAAFMKIAVAAKESGTDAAALASDISFALWTTAIGLMTAIPLMMLASWVHVKVSKLQDAVQQQLGEFLDDFGATLLKPVKKGA